MDSIKIILENGMEDNVEGIFYLYDSKYYFMYTKKELDKNDNVIFYFVKVEKDATNLGSFLGTKISYESDWKETQKIITKILEEKKNNTASQEIQYLPINTLNNLKILSNNIFRLNKLYFEDTFGVILNTYFIAGNEEPILADNYKIIKKPVENETDNIEKRNKKKSIIITLLVIIVIIVLGIILVGLKR